MIFLEKLLNVVPQWCMRFSTCTEDVFPVNFLVEELFHDVVLYMARLIGEELNSVKGMEDVLFVAFGNVNHAVHQNWPQTVGYKLYDLLASNVTDRQTALELVAKEVMIHSYDSLDDFTLVERLRKNASYEESEERSDAKARNDAMLVGSLWSEMFQEEKVEELGPILSFFAAQMAPALFKKSNFNSKNWEFPHHLLEGFAGKLHQASAQAFKKIFPLVGAKWNVSLIDLPLMFGRRPVHRSMKSSLREYMPFSFVSQEPELSMRDKQIWLFSLCFSMMEDYLNTNDGSFAHPCQRYPPCCILKEKAQQFVAEMPMLTTLMSHAKHKARRVEDRTWMLNLFVPDKEHNFGNVDQDPAASIPYCLFDDGSVISQASFQGNVRLKECTSEFLPLATNNGICHAFNALNLFRESSFTSSVFEAYGIEESEATTSPSHLKRGLPRGQGLTFALDRVTLSRGEWFNDFATNRGGFDVAISSWHDSTAFNKRKVSVKLGHHTTIQVKPSVIQAFGEIESVPPQIRDCLFPHEGLEKVTLFNSYSQESCKMECMIKLAEKVCGCTPWDFPHTENGSYNYSICDSLGYFCFVASMKHASHEENVCNCLPDCTMISFQLLPTSVPIDSDKVCQDKSWAHNHAKYFESFRWSSVLVKAFHNLNNVQVKDQMQLCRMLLEEDMALVTVEMAEGGYIQSEKRLRMTLTEKISSFGNRRMHKI